MASGWTPLHACCHSSTTAKAGLAIIAWVLEHGGKGSDFDGKTKRGPGAFNSGWWVRRGGGGTPTHIPPLSFLVRPTLSVSLPYVWCDGGLGPRCTWRARTAWRRWWRGWCRPAPTLTPGTRSPGRRCRCVSQPASRVDGLELLLLRAVWCLWLGCVWGVAGGVPPRLPVSDPLAHPGGRGRQLHPRRQGRTELAIPEGARTEPTGRSLPLRIQGGKLAGADRRKAGRLL